jgi:hypothetical protein
VEELKEQENDQSEESSKTVPLKLKKKAKYKQAVDEHYEFSVDKFKKKILRAFREHIIRQYKGQTRNKQYHWIKSSVRKSVQVFFEQTCGVDSRLYHCHESVFMYFVLKDDNLVGNYGLKEVENDIISVMKLTFGKQPTLSNMRKLFRHRVIRMLWLGEGIKLGCFSESEWMKESMNQMSGEQRRQIEEHLDKVGVSYLRL